MTRLSSEPHVGASARGRLVALFCTTVSLWGCAERPGPGAPATLSGSASNETQAPGAAGSETPKPGAAGSGAPATTAPGEPQGPSADALRQLTASCKQVSSGRYKLDSGGDETVAVCGGEGAVFWTADLDVDCDGRESARCNRRVDPDYQDETAAHDSAGQPLDAAAVPYVVVPAPSDRWSYKDAGLRVGHSVVAVIYGDRVVYGVVGDVGPKALLGEASYAMAERLGMDPNPRHGGADKGVVYVAFTGKDGEADKPDDAAAVERAGKRLAARLAVR